jgi:hypothetical protein
MEYQEITGKEAVRLRRWKPLQWTPCEQIVTVGGGQTSSGYCPMEDFGISSVKPLGSTASFKILYYIFLNLLWLFLSFQ